MALLMAIPMDPPSWSINVLREVAVAVCSELTEFNKAVDTGAIRKLIPNPRRIMENTINVTLLPISMMENNTKEVDSNRIPRIEILRIIPLSASFPESGRVTSMIRALGSRSIALSISE